MDKKNERWLGLDALRGLAVFLMLPVNAGMDFERFPTWMKHAPAAGMTLADFIMPAFVFALGLSQAFSMDQRRARQGIGRIIGHAFLRNLALFAFGTAGYFLVWKEGNWEVLQMLGLAGAIAFPFMFLPPGWRALSALLLTGGIELARPSILEPAFRAWYGSGIGGPLGALPLAVVAIAASIVGEDLVDRRPLFRGVAAAVTGSLTVGAGLAISGWIPPDKHLLSLSYLLIACGASCLALAPIEAALVALRRLGGRPGKSDRGERRGPAAAVDFPVLGPLGRNPLLGYMGGGALTLAVRAWVPASAPAAQAWAASLGVLAIMVLVSIILDRRGLWIRL